METLKKTPFLGTDGVTASTMGAGLTSVGRVDVDHPHTFPNRLIIQETLELVERPVVEESVQHLAPSVLGLDGASLTDVCKFLQYNTVSTIQVAGNLFADSVVDISHKPFPPPRNSFELPFSGASALGLKPFSQPQNLSILFLDATKELPLTCHCEVVDSDIHTDKVSCATVDANICGNNHMEIQPTLPVEEVGCAVFPADVLLEVFGDTDIESTPALDCAETHNIVFKGEGASIIAYSQKLLHLGLTNLPTFLASFTDSLQGLIRFVTTTTNKLCRKFRESLTDGIIGLVVELQFSHTRTIASIDHLLCRPRILLHSFEKNLVRGQSYLNHSTGNHSKPYEPPVKRVQRAEEKYNRGEKAQFLPRLKPWVSLSRF